MDRGTHIPTIVLRPVLILTDEGLEQMTAHDVELCAFVHVDDVAEAIVRSLDTDIDTHVRLTLCGPGEFDASEAGAFSGGNQPERGLRSACSSDHGSRKFLRVSPNCLW